MMIQIVGDSPEARAGRAEIARLTQKAARYDQLTRALAELTGRYRDVLLGDYRVHVGECEDFDPYENPIPHDGTPESIANAIIKAAQPAPAPASPESQE